MLELGRQSLAGNPGDPERYARTFLEEGCSGSAHNGQSIARCLDDAARCAGHIQGREREGASLDLESYVAGDQHLARRRHDAGRSYRRSDGCVCGICQDAGEREVFSVSTKERSRAGLTIDIDDPLSSGSGLLASRERGIASHIAGQGAPVYDGGGQGLVGQSLDINGAYDGRQYVDAVNAGRSCLMSPGVIEVNGSRDVTDTSARVMRRTRRTIICAGDGEGRPGLRSDENKFLGGSVVVQRDDVGN